MAAVKILSLSGQLEDVDSVPASDIKNAFAKVMDVVAEKGVVAVTRHNQARAVLVDLGEFESLVRRAGDPLAKLSSRFDAMFEAMQGKASGNAMYRAFHATPTQMGKAAVAQAGKTRSSSSKGRRRAHA